MPAMSYWANNQDEDEERSVLVQQNTIKQITFFKQALSLPFADTQVVFTASCTSLGA